MGLSGEIKESIEDWKIKSPLFKVIAIFGLFMAISSITSIADTIFQWKGFIKDGLDFYRNYISKPIGDSFKLLFDLNYTSYAIDYILLLVIIISINIRYFIQEHKNKLISTKKLVRIIIAIVFSIFSVFLLNDFSSLPNGIFNAYSIFFLIWFIILLIISVKVKKIRKAIFAPIVAVIIVFILAAINKGFVS